MLFNVVIFLGVLSLLVFVHELGHFMAAKGCGIFVDRFSIGMPPRLFGFKWGDTDYCIGALPFGGFVKMAGQEDAPLTEEERAKDYGHVPPHRWFNNKPVWQRFIVILAGPAMNVLLAIVIYAIIAGFGANVPDWELSARIGKVEENSPAETAPLYLERPGAAFTEYSGTPDAVGWKTGDLVLTLDGKRIDNISDIAINAILGGEKKEHYAELDRTNTDGSTSRYVSVITPALLEDAEKYPRFGVGPFETPLIGMVKEGFPAGAAGIKEGDIIKRANGEIVDSGAFVKLVEKQTDGKPLDLDLDRNGQAVHVQVAPKVIGRLEGVYVGPSVETADLQIANGSVPVVAGVDTEAAKAIAIKRKDKIVEVNGQPATLELFQRLERETPGGALHVNVERPAVGFGMIQKPATLSLDLPIKAVGAVGVVFTAREVFHRLPPSKVLPEAFRQSYQSLERTVRTLTALVSGKVSPTALGGPVMIFDVTTKAAHEGGMWLLKIIAFISVNLAVFNLLPLPVLDGGLIVIIVIEAIRRKPISPVFLERFQQVGLIFIIGLMLFVTYNDIGRIIMSAKP